MGARNPTSASWRGLLAAAVLALALTAATAPAHAASPKPEDRVTRVLEELTDGINAQLTKSGTRDTPDSEESLLATPPLADLIAGRAELTLDPAFWTQIVANLLVSQTAVLPAPVDLVKIEAVLPTAKVGTSKRHWKLARRAKPLGEVTYRWQNRTKTIDEFVRSTETDAVAFIHKGRITTDLYANGWSAGVRHQPWSVTKSFVSALIGIAKKEGKVGSLNAPIQRYIPELRGTAWHGTTLRNLLQMESGVHWDESTPVLIVNTQVEQWVQMALDLLTDGALGQTRNEFLQSLPRVAPQGTEFSYNSGNTQVLAWLLERAYDRPFNRIITQKLWKPMGMAGDAMVMTDRVGDAIASQGLYSRVFDLARFGELFRNGGRTPDGRQIVPAAWVKASTRMTGISDGQYAYQWWRAPTPGGFEASGFQGQKISVAPTRCLTAVRLSHTLGLNFRPGGGDPTDPASYGAGIEMGGDEWWAAFRAVAKHLGTCPKRAR